MVYLRAALVFVLFAYATAAQEFDVASVKPNKSSDYPYANFPLGPGDNPLTAWMIGFPD